MLKGNGLDNNDGCDNARALNVRDTFNANVGIGENETKNILITRTTKEYVA